MNTMTWNESALGVFGARVLGWKADKIGPKDFDRRAETTPHITLDISPDECKNKNWSK